MGAIAAFGNGEPAVLVIRNIEPETPPAAAKPKQQPLPASSAPSKPADRPAGPGGTTAEAKVPGRQATGAKDPEWFFDVICPIPNKGQRRDDYLKDPDSIGTLYAAMKDGDQAAQKRLWGFAKHWQPEPREYKGKTYPVSKEETLFREALDSFVEWEEKHKQDPQQPLLPPEDPGQDQAPQDDDVPF